MAENRNTDPRSRALRTMLGAAALLVAVAACGGDSPAPRSGVSVVATTSVLGDLARNVVGDEGTVTVLVPVGSDPHDFRASSDQIALLNEADLVLANGLGLEESLADVLRAASDDGVAVVELAGSLDPIGLRGDPDEGRDPHVWLDLRRMADAAQIVGDELARIAPAGTWSVRASAYRDELIRTDAAIAAAVADLPADRRKLVTNHDALGYFAQRYGFEIVGVVVPGGSTLSDPSSRDLADLIEAMRREEVAVIFAETTRPDSLAEAVAAEIGYPVEIVTLFTGSLGEPGSGADTLVGMVTTNAYRIVDALQN